MPPRVARLPVEMSTGKARLCVLSVLLSVSRVMPGSTTQLRLSTSSDTIDRRYLEQSTTSARPTAWPHCDVPPPRGSTGTPCSRAIAIAASMSLARFGMTTPSGSIW